MERLTQAHTRVVWVQDLANGDDFYAHGNNLRLMGLDSRDGRGERPLVPETGQYSKPLITPDGQQVLYTDGNREQVFILNWDGTGLRELTTGRTLTTWRDPVSGTQWVYVGRNRIGPKENNTHGIVVRVNLDDPGIEEPVWDTIPVNENNFQLSADGARASVNTPQGIGLADLTTGDWQRYGGGCWTSLAPDNSYLLWRFEGTHRHVIMAEPGNRNRRTIDIGGGHGIDGHRVFHPRWSNHPRFFVVTGPFPDGVRRGGHGVEIHLGRFNADVTAVDDWVRVSDNEYADFYPHAWVDPGTGASVARQSEVDPAPRVDAPDSTASWASLGSDTVFLWENQNSKNEVIDAATGARTYYSVLPQKRARFGRHFEMVPAGGRFVVEESQALSVMERIRTGSGLSLEALIKPDTRSLDELLPVMTFVSATGDPGPGIWQGNDQLLFVTGSGEPLVLTPDPMDDLLHVVINYDQGGTLEVFVNGLPTVSRQTDFDVSGLDATTLHFGGCGAEEDWAGTIESVRIGLDSVSPEGAARRFSALQSRMQNRAPAQEAVVSARLVERSTLPSPQDIAPYSRALVANTYVLEEVLEGDVEAETFLAAHWVIMDHTLLEDAVRNVGETYQMTLHPFDDHPELEGEWLGMDVSDPLLPIFYDLSL